MAYQLSEKGRQCFKSIRTNMAKAYGSNSIESFSIEPSMAQTLIERIVVDGNPFLNGVNIVPVSEMKGEKIGMDVVSRITGRVQVSDTVERVPKDPLSMVSKQYELFEVQSDLAIPYRKVDQWAKFNDFQARYNNYYRRAIGNDLLICGWFGERYEANTDIVANPNLQDLQSGWLHQIRNFDDGKYYMKGTTQVPLVFNSLDFPNLDYLVKVAVGLLDPVFRNAPGLVAYVGSNLAASEDLEFAKAYGRSARDKVEVVDQNVKLTKKYGNLPTEVPPFFPENALLVTLPKENLSIYYQDTSWRRTFRDHAPKSRWEQFESRNQSYEVEDFRATALIDTITFAPAP